MVLKTLTIEFRKMSYQLYNYENFATGAQPEDCVAETRRINEALSAMRTMIRQKPKKQHFHIFDTIECKIVLQRVAKCQRTLQ